MLCFTWVLGAMYAYIPITNTYTRPFEHENVTYYECSYDNEISVLKRRLFASSNFVLTFLLPLLVLICSYSAIMSKLLAEQRNRPLALRFPAGFGGNATQVSSNNVCTVGQSSSMELQESTTTTTTTAEQSQEQNRLPRRRLTKKLFIIRHPRKFLSLGVKSKKNSSKSTSVDSKGTTPAGGSPSADVISQKVDNNFSLRKSAPYNHRSKVR